MLEKRLKSFKEKSGRVRESESRRSTGRVSDRDRERAGDGESEVEGE